MNIRTSLLLIFSLIVLILIITDCKKEMKDDISVVDTAITSSPYMTSFTQKPLISPASEVLEPTSILTPIPSPAVNSPKPSQKSSPYIFVTKWGSKGDKDNEFNAPLYITIDSDGFIYIEDFKLQHKVWVNKFDSSGNFITRWELTRDNAQISVSSGITVGGYNLIYVGECGEGQIYKFDCSGNLLTRWPVDRGAYGSITADPEGNIFTIGEPFIYKFTPDGKLINKWEISNYHGFNRGYFIGNAKIGPSGCIYLLQYLISGDGHAKYHSIDKYDSNMKFITQWGYDSGISISSTNPIKKDEPHLPFANSIRISMDSKENILVVNAEHNRIHIYDSSGKYIGKFGSTGSGDGQFNEPIDLVGDKEGNIYVSDYGNCRIQKFSPNPDFNKNN